MIRNELITHSKDARDAADIQRRETTGFEAIVTQFDRLAEKPMAGDKKMGAFYTAAKNLTRTNEPFRDLIQTASERDTTPDHMANLLLRGVQYIEIFENQRTGYDDSFNEPQAWEDLLVGPNGVVTEHKEELQDILDSKETTTTKYSRYAGVKTALNALFPDQEVKVADFGCGANYGLQGLRGDLAFPTINIEVDRAGGTETGHRQKKIRKLLNHPVQLAEGLAVDKTDPAGEEERKWRIACSFYPGELSDTNLNAMKSLEERIADVDQTGMNFLQGNLLELQTNHADGTLPSEHFDAVVMSTILYQMTPEEQKHMIKTAKKSLNPNGVIILQDFATKSETQEDGIGLHIKGLNPEPYSYRTFVMARDETEWREFLQWSNGRCKDVKPGEDFDRVKQVTRRRHTDATQVYPTV